MKTLLVGLAALSLAATALPAASALAAQPVSTNRTSLEEANARLVTDFYNLAFNEHKPTEAARRYIGEQYIQHNPGVPNGAAAFYGYFEGYFREHPQSRATINRVIVDGDIVALHIHSQADANDPGSAIVDIFRVENGKIVEHFDVIQAVPTTPTANGNTMFGGTKAD